jgi:hypothetical protein
MSTAGRHSHACNNLGKEVRVLRGTESCDYLLDYLVDSTVMSYFRTGVVRCPT